MTEYEKVLEIPEELIEDIEGYPYCDSEKERCMNDCSPLGGAFMSQEK